MARQTSLIIVAPVRPALQDICECSVGRHTTFKNLMGPNSRYMHCTGVVHLNWLLMPQPKFYHNKMCLWIMMNNNYCGPGELSQYSDWLRAGRSRDRILVGARFFTHVQTGPEVHPASCTMGTGSFHVVKRLGRDADHTPPSITEVIKG
jgi:hypothetical protein